MPLTELLPVIVAVERDNRFSVQDGDGYLRQIAWAAAHSRNHATRDMDIRRTMLHFVAGSGCLTVQNRQQSRLANSCIAEKGKEEVLEHRQLSVL